VVIYWYRGLVPALWVFLEGIIDIAHLSNSFPAYTRIVKELIDVILRMAGVTVEQPVLACIDARVDDQSIVFENSEEGVGTFGRSMWKDHCFRTCETYSGAFNKYLGMMLLDVSTTHHRSAPFHWCLSLPKRCRCNSSKAAGFQRRDRKRITKDFFARHAEQRMIASNQSMTSLVHAPC
jgi:hypothetical protein